MGSDPLCAYPSIENLIDMFQRPGYFTIPAIGIGQTMARPESSTPPVYYAYLSHVLSESNPLHISRLQHLI